MATLAYTSEELTQPGLDAWFGEGVARDRTDIVDEFRAEYDANNAAVFFKLFEFPDIGLGVISIRGTSNNWDMLADSQLWSAAGKSLSCDQTLFLSCRGAYSHSTFYSSCN